MKRLLIVCMAFAASLPVLAQSTDWTIREVRDPVQLRAKLNSDGADIVEAIAAQSDTNATTTVTLYTPRRVGDILIGGKGAGTNLVCVSKGTTTNDWVQVVP